MASGTRAITAWQRDKYAIVGIGATDFSRQSGRSELTLAAQASAAALADAGLSPSDVDGIVRCDYDEVRPHDLAAALGVTDLS
jgi:acetyl-CoA acetyltransferase